MDIQEKNFTYKELIENLRKKKYRNIVFLTGAGISTSAGIPDFRSEAGVYSTLQKYNLDYPEQIFEIQYFKQNPKPFCEVHAKFVSAKIHFTSCHFFISEMNRREQLLYNFSQNVDGLELEAGLPLNKLCQVHGNLRGARCQKCGFKNSIELFNESILAGDIYKCVNCKRGLVRPNVVFFGEQLDKGYRNNFPKICQADLVFIIGTSMQVAPFSLIIDQISPHKPIVLINRDKITLSQNKYIHMKGDIDDNVEQIMRDLEWEYPAITRTYPQGWKSGVKDKEVSEEKNQILADVSQDIHKMNLTEKEDLLKKQQENVLEQEQSDSSMKENKEIEQILQQLESL